MNNKTKWDKNFLSLAQQIALWSKDPSTKVGAIIVNKDKRIITTGYNGIPQYLNDNIKKRQIPPIKYYWFEHAERNAIYQAAKFGVSIKNCILYTTLYPCTDCARGIIQSGIIRIVTLRRNKEKKQWIESWETAEEMFKEAKIKIKEY
jgi:dCMP deaminase